jgi:hypothetical protein
MATIDDLQQLFRLQQETLATEFKDWLDLSEKHARATLGKAAVALANHGGGTVVFGMGGKPPTSQPRPTTIARYTSDAANAAVNKYSDTPLDCEVVHLNHPTSGHEHAFVVVPGGHASHVMSKKEFPGVIQAFKVYTRKPEPKSEEPLTAAEWRELNERIVRNGREALLDSFRVIMLGSAVTPAPKSDKLTEFIEDARRRWRKHVETLPADDRSRHQDGYFEHTFEIEGAEKLDLSDLKAALEEASKIKHTGFTAFAHLMRHPVHPVPKDGAIEAWLGYKGESKFGGRHSDYWRVSPDGRLFLLRGYEEDYFPELVERGKGFDLINPIRRLGEALLFVSRLGNAWHLLGDPHVVIRAEYTGLSGRALNAYFGNREGMNHRISHTDAVQMRGRVRASDIQGNLVEVLAPLLKPLYEVFDFYQLPRQFLIEEVERLRNARY